MANAKTQTPFAVRKSRKRSPPSPRLGTRAAVRTFATGRGDLARHLKPSYRVKKALRSRHHTRSTRAHRAIPRFYWPRRTSSSERRERRPNFRFFTLLKLCNSEVGFIITICKTDVAEMHITQISHPRKSSSRGFFSARKSRQFFVNFSSVRWRVHRRSSSRENVTNSS